MLAIYCVHPISGCSADEVFDYYDKTKIDLTDAGYDVFVPMYGKNNLRTELEFKAEGYKDNPLTTNHAIFNQWMVKQADILYANFIGATRVSIGSMFELAWGSDNDKQVIIVMEKDNIHRHAFVLESGTIVFETTEEAMTYLKNLASKEF
jgi:hypothetical protein